ncbi:MAG: 3-oxoacyl-[acyl-carrier protein] reductase [Bradymonadia bacterium]|jgi:3-oxoacyl-[acyl-carrier protein] reductase
MNLQDLKIIVTGAASGMGRHFTLRLAEAGAQVSAWDLDEDGLSALKEAAADSTGTVHTFVCDVANEDQVVSSVAKSAEAMSGLNGLINNAGIIRDGLLVRKDRKTGDISKMSLSSWQKVIDVNLTGPFLCAREFAAKCIENGVDAGCIVNISSVSRNGNVGQTNYSAAKAGLVADTTLWAKELARHNIRVGAIAPGFVRTPILEGMRQDALEKLMKLVPLRRLAEPEELWLSVKFIIECDYFTGRCIDVDGGLAL